MEMSEFAILADRRVLLAISPVRDQACQIKQGSSIPMETAMVSRDDYQHRHCPGRPGVALSATWRLADVRRDV